MCRAKIEGGRRCTGGTRWCVNREGHERFGPDPEQERHWHKPVALLSMTPAAIRTRRSRACAYAAEVDAMRTVHAVRAASPIGPVLREELWAHRYQRAALSLKALAERFRAVAAEEGVPVDEVAARYQKQQVKPHRQRAGERLADLVVDDSRPDWVAPAHLVRMVEPPENGTPNAVYVRALRDLDGTEYLLVTSYDGSEPMAWPHDAAGLKAAAWEALERARAVDADAYEAWEAENGMRQTAAAPYTQGMTDADFLATSEQMHLT